MATENMSFKRSCSLTRITRDFQRPLVGGETTSRQLLDILHNTRSGGRWSAPTSLITTSLVSPSLVTATLGSSARSSSSSRTSSSLVQSSSRSSNSLGSSSHDESSYGYHHNENVDCDEVYPNIYVGDEMTARNKDYLRKLGITHVINAAEGRYYGYVNTSRSYYRDTPIKYLGLPMADWPSTDITRHFSSASDFINDAISSRGKVFVHCVQGVSRSATCVVAYLMLKRGLRAPDAIRTVRLHRNIYPNEGFLTQLATLDNQLRRRRLLF